MKRFAILFVVLGLFAGCAGDMGGGGDLDTGEGLEIQEKHQNLVLPTKSFNILQGASISQKAVWFVSDVTDNANPDQDLAFPPYSQPIANCGNPNSNAYYQYKISPDGLNNVSWDWDIGAFPIGLPTSSLQVRLCAYNQPFGSGPQLINPGTPGVSCIDVTNTKVGSTAAFNDRLFNKGTWAAAPQGMVHFYILYAITGQGTGAISPAIQGSDLHVNLNVTRYGSGGC